MAKKSSPGRPRNISSIARPRLVRPIRLRPLSPLSLWEDRRSFHPLQEFRPPVVFTRPAARKVVLDKPSRPFRFPDVFKFAVPKRVVLCVRREQRREVLFAKRKTRSGAGSRKRRNYWSKISCR